MISLLVPGEEVKLIFILYSKDLKKTEFKSSDGEVISIRSYKSANGKKGPSLVLEYGMGHIANIYSPKISKGVY